MRLNPVTNNLNFKARVDFVGPKHLVKFLDSYPDVTIRARMMQEVIDAVTLAKEKAPLFGTQSDCLCLDFRTMTENKDNFVKVTYNTDDKGYLNIRENPLSAVADMIKDLTEGEITREQSLKPFKLWREFSYSEKDGVLERTRYKQKGNGRFTIAKVQKTTIEELTEKLKQLIGIN